MGSDELATLKIGSVQSFSEYCVNYLALSPDRPCATRDAIQALHQSCLAYITDHSNYRTTSDNVLVLDKQDNRLRWTTPTKFGPGFRDEVCALLRKSEGPDGPRKNVVVKESEKGTPAALVGYVLHHLDKNNGLSRSVHARKNLKKDKPVILYRGHVMLEAEERPFMGSMPAPEAACAFSYMENIPLSSKSVQASAKIGHQVEILLSSPPCIDRASSWGGFLNDVSSLEEALTPVMADSVRNLASAIARDQGDTADQWITGTDKTRVFNVHMVPCLCFNLKSTRQEINEVEFFMVGVTTRDVAQGEELLLQYGKDYFDSQRDRIVNIIRNALRTWQVQRANDAAIMKLIDTVEQGFDTDLTPRPMQLSKRLTGAIDALSHMHLPHLQDRVDLTVAELSGKRDKLALAVANAASHTQHCSASSHGTATGQPPQHTSHGVAAEDDAVQAAPAAADTCIGSADVDAMRFGGEGGCGVDEIATAPAAELMHEVCPLRSSLAAAAHVFDGSDGVGVRTLVGRAWSGFHGWQDPLASIPPWEESLAAPRAEAACTVGLGANAHWDGAHTQSADIAEARSPPKCADVWNVHLSDAVHSMPSRRQALAGGSQCVAQHRAQHRAQHNWDRPIKPVKPYHPCAVIDRALRRAEVSDIADAGVGTDVAAGDGGDRDGGAMDGDWGPPAQHSCRKAWEAAPPGGGPQRSYPHCDRVHSDAPCAARGAAMECVAAGGVGARMRAGSNMRPWREAEQMRAEEAPFLEESGPDDSGGHRICATGDCSVRGSDAWRGPEHAGTHAAPHSLACGRISHARPFEDDEGECRDPGANGLGAAWFGIPADAAFPLAASDFESKFSLGVVADAGERAVGDIIVAAAAMACEGESEEPEVWGDGGGSSPGAAPPAADAPVTARPVPRTAAPADLDTPASALTAAPADLVSAVVKVANDDDEDDDDPDDVVIVSGNVRKRSKVVDIHLGNVLQYSKRRR